MQNQTETTDSTSTEVSEPKVSMMEARKSISSLDSDSLKELSSGSKTIDEVLGKEEKTEEEKTTTSQSSDKTEEKNNSVPNEEESQKNTEDSPEEKEEEESSVKKDEFVFDKQSFIDKGITDEKALEELERLAKSNFHSQKQINKQSSEVGDSRKRIELLNEKIKAIEEKGKLTKDQFNEQFEEDPYAAQQAFNADLANQQEGLALKQELLVEQTKQTLEQTLGEGVFEKQKDSIVELLNDYGTNQEFIDVIKEQPYSLGHGLLFLLAKGSESKKALKEASSKNKELIKQIESLKSNTNDIAENIIKAAKKGPVINNSGAGGGSTLKTPASRSEIAAMSLEELNSLQDELKNKL